MNNLAPITAGPTSRRQAEASAVALEAFAIAGFALLFQVVAAAKVKQGTAIEQVIIATTDPTKAEGAFDHFVKQGREAARLYAYLRIDVYDPREASGWRGLDRYDFP